LSPRLSTHALERARERLACRHLGTLGGGNHFLELDRDAENGLWLLVHSGSRGLGAAVAKHHARAAKASEGELLATLDVDRDEGSAYFDDVSWALDFARANRGALARRALEVVSDVLGDTPDCTADIDIHHNFVARERWYGRALLVHRKGAVAIPSGTLSLIPGSMGTASYIVEGLGSHEAFGSCSHGAGRVMSRREARAAIRPDALVQTMRRVVYPEHLTRHLVEEAPAAYRDIGEVLDDQQDLVRRRIRLEPIAVLKG
jgi:tRNA-splicing ligase RtcB